MFARRALLAAPLAGLLPTNRPVDSLVVPDDKLSKLLLCTNILRHSIPEGRPLSWNGLAAREMVRWSLLEYEHPERGPGRQPGLDSNRQGSRSQRDCRSQKTAGNSRLHTT